MILEKFEIEIMNELTENSKEKFKEKFNNLDFSKVVAVNTNIISNENLLLSEMGEIGVIVSTECEKINKNLKVYMSTCFDNTYIDGKMKVEISTSDNENEFVNESIIGF